MREYRGKRVDNGEWVTGFLVKQLGDIGFESDDNGEDFFLIGEHIEEMFEVIPETVGQATGLYDKDKTPIYEDDVVKEYTKPGYVNHEELFKVIFCKDFCRYELTPNDFNTHKLTYYTRCKVVGNIHENPELLHKEMKS